MPKMRVEGFVDENMIIEFEMGPAVGGERHIKAYFLNVCGSDITGLNMQIAVQKHLKAALQPATSSVLSGDGKSTVQQEMKITNSLEGTKPIVIKIKVNYTCNGKTFDATKTVSFS
eukprot:TRINITY_DN1231_c0_g1_i13.p2 TRINITY_DN1231_c0_g1~~TRINITY_DN1231_c0_g1_i13.p2  ORF type:complete len:116 (+),score=29.93 TRINITY_DN1231_c0_g1_i13:159-506(+)